MPETSPDGGRRDELRLRSGHIPPLAGDTVAVLIVTDDAEVAGVLAPLLRGEGYECTLATDAAEAGAHLAKQSFAAALVDVSMRSESGLPLLGDLGKDGDLAVVLVATVEDLERTESALKSAVHGFLVQPFLPGAVRITVANALRWRRLESERDSRQARPVEGSLADRIADLVAPFEPSNQTVDPQSTAAPDSEAIFRDLLEAAPDAIVAVDAHGRIVMANAQTERLFGYRREELLGQAVEMLVPERARAGHPQWRSQYVGDPQPRPMGAGRELAGRRKDGSEFPAEISLSAIDTARGVWVSAAIRDVSDRKRAEAKLEALLEDAPDAIVGVDRDGRIALVNAQAERLFAYRREELLGQPVELLVPDQVRAIHPALRMGYFADPKPRPMGAGMELAGRRKDGSEFPAEISLSALETEDGLLVSAAVRDVSDRRQADEARAWLASIVQSSHDAVIGKTLDGLITSWNPAAERLYGYKAAELTGHELDPIIPPHRRDEEHEILGRIAQGERIEQYQTERLRRDGTSLKVSLTVSPISDSTGSIVGVASVSRDISELERAEAKFRALLEAAPDAIVGVDRAGRIALVNAQAERLFGYRHEELIGQLVELLVPEHARVVHPDHRDRYVGDPRPRPMGAGMELAGRHKDGTEFPAEISLSAIDTDDGLVVTAGIRDVTDRKRLEQTLREQNIAFERANLAKDRFLASMSHELRTPLNAILGFTGTLLMGLPGALNDEQRTQLETVRNSARHLLAIINDLLDLAKIESGKVQLALEAVDCHAVVGDVATSLRPQAETKGLAFHVDCPDHTVTAWADRRALTQILLNLANNAVKFTEAGTVRIAVTEPASTGEGTGGVRIDVVDTGIGISAADQERLFDPFEQLGNQRASHQEGTGLGLHISRKLAELLGATIHCSSIPDQGSTFTVELKRG